MEKRFLLDGIALHSAHVAPGHIERSILVVADLANTGLSLSNRATMPAGEAADAIALNRLVEFAFAYLLIEDFAEGIQGIPLLYILREEQLRG
jgi:hypothetical protein